MSQLPTPNECDQLFIDYNVPKNINEHCLAVSGLAVKIAQQLQKKGIKINIDLIRAGSRMHDWMKAATFERLKPNKKFNFIPASEEIDQWAKIHERFKGRHESEIAYELLKDKYPKLAQFIKTEGGLSADPLKPRDWEEKIVHYADWRVLGTRIVPLDVRLDDFFARYNKMIIKNGMERWNKIKEVEHQAEKEICTVLDVSPEEL